MEMPFGKFRGYDVKDLPDFYLAWLVSLDDLRANLADAVEEEWRHRHYHPDAEKYEE